VWGETTFLITNEEATRVKPISSEHKLSHMSPESNMLTIKSQKWPKQALCVWV